MPYKILIPLHVVNCTNPKLFEVGGTNRALRAIFLKWMAEQGVNLKHDYTSEFSPYTISPLIKDKNDSAHFTITLLQDHLWQPLQNRLSKKRRTIFIWSSELNIEHENQICSYCDYADLWRNSSHDNVIQLDFLSPTTFRSNSKNYPLPDPSFVFRSLMQKWNCFAPGEFKIDDTWMDWVKENVAIMQSYPITEKVKLWDKATEIGFVGQVEYNFVKNKKNSKEVHDENCEIANTLADFSNYCGVGAKTTYGLGQTMRITKFMKSKPIKRNLDIDPLIYRLFISYSSKDAEIVNDLAKMLQKAGFNIWLDQKDIVIGQPVLDRIREGVTKESDYVLIILSENSTVSEWCKLELRMAYEKELDLKRVVVLPIRIDESDVPVEVKTKKYFQLDLHNQESANNLINQIKSLVKKQA